MLLILEEDNNQIFYFELELELSWTILENIVIWS